MRDEGSGVRGQGSGVSGGDLSASVPSPLTPDPSPLRLCILDSATVPHGAAFWARGMAERLAARGHRVSLLCPPQSPLREPPPGADVVLRTVRLRNNVDLIAVAALVTHLRRERAEVFLFQGTRGTRLGALAARLAHVPGVVRAGSGEGLKTTAYDRWLFRHGVTHFIANAGFIERELTALPWVGPGRVTRIYNGIDLARFQATGARALRRASAIPEAAPVIAVVARLQALKGHEDLLRCLPALWAEFPELRVLVAGQGPHEAALRALVEEIDARGRVLFLGHCADVRPVLEAADLFVLPSHKEGLPNAILEAMAMGLPIVATAAGGTGELVIHGETGLLVPPGDAAALDAAVAQMLRDTALRQRVVQAASRRLEAQFSLPNSVEQVEALLRRVARR